MLKNIPMRCSGEAQRLCDWLAGGLSAVIHFFRFPPSDRRARQWAMSSRVGCRASDELVLNGDCSAKNPEAEIWSRPHWPVRMQQKWWPTTRSPQVHNCFHQCLISGCLEAIFASLSFFFYTHPRKVTPPCIPLSTVHGPLILCQPPHPPLKVTTNGYDR